MRWRDVDYLCHRLPCLVRYDTPDKPGVVDEWAGIIECPRPGAAAVLISFEYVQPRYVDPLPFGHRYVYPPDGALVVIAVSVPR
jgi:hypothetical protein